MITVKIDVASVAEIYQKDMAKSQYVTLVDLTTGSQFKFSSDSVDFNPLKSVAGGAPQVNTFELEITTAMYDGELKNKLVRIINRVPLSLSIAPAAASQDKRAAS